jgi:hypothetical protein
MFPEPPKFPAGAPPVPPVDETPAAPTAPKAPPFAFTKTPKVDPLTFDGVPAVAFPVVPPEPQEPTVTVYVVSVKSTAFTNTLVKPALPPPAPPDTEAPAATRIPLPPPPPPPTHSTTTCFAPTGLVHVLEPMNRSI